MVGNVHLPYIHILLNSVSKMARFPRLWLLPVSEFYLFVHGWFTEVNFCFTLRVLLRDFQIWISTEFKLDGVRSGVRYQPFPPVWNDMKQYEI